MPRRKDSIDLKRLPGAISYSRREHEFYRTEIVEATKEYSGQHYAINGAEKRVPLNWLDFYVRTTAPSLLARDPRMSLSTHRRHLKHAVATMQDWGNDQIQRMHFAHIQQRTIVNSLFGYGVNLVALASPAEAASKSWRLRAGMPFIANIDPDNHIVDMSARDRDEMAFEGDILTVPYESVMDFRMFTPKSRARLQPSERRQFNEQGDERITEISKSGGSFYDSDWRQMLELARVYIPSTGEIVYYAYEDIRNGREADPLEVQNWLGPECGPYHWLFHKIVPGNLLPKGPVMDLIDLAQSANVMERKLLRQSFRQKTTTAVKGGADGDAKRLTDASDGDAWRSDFPEQIAEVVSGGPNQAVFQMLMETNKHFDVFAGGLLLQSGVAPTSKTAAQDKMINENNSRQTADMQDTTVTHVAGVLRSLCWYWYHHPELRMVSHYKVQGTSFSIPREVTPGERSQFAYSDIALKVDPYSLQHKTPQQRLQYINGVWNQMAPWAPIMQQQGYGPNIPHLLKLFRELGDEPEIEELFMLQPPPVESTTQEGEVGKPQISQRSYTRDNNTGSAAEEAMEAGNAAASTRGNWNGPMAP